MSRRGVVLVSALLLSVGATSASAVAGAMDAKQIQIVAKVFNFLEKKPPSGATILVTPGSADTAAVKSALGALNVVEGPVSGAAGAFAVFVGSAADATAAKAANASILTIGGDVACVDSASCVIAIETQPKVSIYASRAAATKAGIDFDPSFKMLITER